jgi:hypothetical protein
MGTEDSYRKLIGNLNYLTVATRPNIAFAVGRLTSFLDCYWEEHWNAAIHAFMSCDTLRALEPFPLP